MFFWLRIIIYKVSGKRERIESDFSCLRPWRVALRQRCHWEIRVVCQSQRSLQQRFINQILNCSGFFRHKFKWLSCWASQDLLRAQTLTRTLMGNTVEKIYDERKHLYDAISLLASILFEILKLLLSKIKNDYSKLCFHMKFPSPVDVDQKFNKIIYFKAAWWSRMLIVGRELRNEN